MKKNGELSVLTNANLATDGGDAVVKYKDIFVFVYVTEVKPGDAVETNPMGGDGVVRMSTGQEEGQ